MASKAASLMEHGRGVLVLDNYALAAVIVSREIVLDGAPHMHGIGLGVRMTLPAGRAHGRLRSRLADLASCNVTLAEWRANLPLERIPRGAVHAAAASLAEGAAASLAEGVTPILTLAMPDLESQGEATTYAATANALTALSTALVRADVNPAAVLLRVNMIVSGSADCAQPKPFQVAESTLAVLDESIDHDLGGVVLLSSGQSLERACENLLAIADLAHKLSSPWPITFGFTRAVVGESLDVSEVKSEQRVHGLGYVQVKNEQFVHDALVRACDQAFQSASGSADPAECDDMDYAWARP